jgi:hypothetical protein
MAVDTVNEQAANVHAPLQEIFGRAARPRWRSNVQRTRGLDPSSFAIPDGEFEPGMLTMERIEVDGVALEIGDEGEVACRLGPRVLWTPTRRVRRTMGRRHRCIRSPRRCTGSDSRVRPAGRDSARSQTGGRRRTWAIDSHIATSPDRPWVTYIAEHPTRGQGLLRDGPRHLQPGVSSDGRSTLQRSVGD